MDPSQAVRDEIADLSRGDLEIMREATVRLAGMEGFSGHSHAVEVRLE